LFKANKIAESGDILITVRAPVGPTNLNRERSCIGRGLAALRVGTNLDRNYLFNFLGYLRAALAKAGTGSTFTAISREDLKYQVSLPPSRSNSGLPPSCKKLTVCAAAPLCASVE
jgi:type I restriction enzyme S subunit